MEFHRIAGEVVVALLRHTDWLTQSSCRLGMTMRGAKANGYVTSPDQDSRVPFGRPRGRFSGSAYSV